MGAPLSDPGWKVTRARPAPVADTCTSVGASGRSRTMSLTVPSTTRSASPVASMTR